MTRRVGIRFEDGSILVADGFGTRSPSELTDEESEFLAQVAPIMAEVEGGYALVTAATTGRPALVMLSKVAMIMPMEEES